MITQLPKAKLWRALRVVIAVLLAAYGLLFVLARIHETIVRSRSEAIYKEFLKLHPRRTTKSDVEHLLKQPGFQTPDVNCGGGDCEYTIGNAWSGFSVVRNFAIRA